MSKLPPRQSITVKWTVLKFSIQINLQIKQRTTQSAPMCHPLLRGFAVLLVAIVIHNLLHIYNLRKCSNRHNISANEVFTRYQDHVETDSTITGLV